MVFQSDYSSFAVPASNCSNYIIEKGSLRIAQTSGRLHTFKRQYYTTTALGIDCEILSHEKLREKVPIVDP
ncbi:unnamed protein product [Adineta steineri]|uniref:Uncharacterized protein n=1 Tax=Adineta steineri TaxID=433720 RepID=A0A814G1L8_9BILA|nr:unnamed protein product [Adineta steineri]